MTIARAAAIGALVVAIIAVGVLMFGGGGGTEYTVHLQTANQLVKGNEVRVGGLAVGEITDIKLSEDNQADIKIEVKDDFAPLRRGSSMTVRWESLPSVANRYLALHPGPNNAPEIP
jgi:phospholipid/cholesterol/gamma-HCH transport system substrate-binding protein